MTVLSIIIIFRCLSALQIDWTSKVSTSRIRSFKNYKTFLALTHLTTVDLCYCYGKSQAFRGRGGDFDNKFHEITFYDPHSITSNISSRTSINSQELLENLKEMYVQ